MARRKTKEVKFVKLPEERIREIETLVAAWPFETKSFMRARLHQYRPPRAAWQGVKAAVRGFFFSVRRPKLSRF